MRILVVGHIRPCHQRLHDDGHASVLLMPRDRLSAADLAAPHASIIALDADATLAQWRDCAASLHRTCAFDAVACYTDRYHAMASQIARHLGVFCTIDETLLANACDKYRMRQVLDEAGLNAGSYRRAQGREQLLEAIAAVGYPCIVKPVAGQASIGVARLDGAADIDRALAWVGAGPVAHGVIVEQFLDGQEYSVEAISVAGRHHIVAVTLKFKDPVTFVELGHLIPAPLGATVKQQIENYVCAVLTALGFRDSASHTQLIMTSGGPRIIETHTRLAGDYIPELARQATGIDLYALSARQSIGALSPDMLPRQIEAVQSAAIWYACPAADPGQMLAQIDGVDHAQTVAGVQQVVTLKPPGAPGAQVRQSFDRSACAIAVGATGAAALAASRQAIARLRFVYTGDNGTASDAPSVQQAAH